MKRTKHALKVALVGVLSGLLALVGFALPATAAMPAGVTVSTSYGNNAAISDGSTHKLTLQYESFEVDPGSTVTIQVPSQVDPESIVLPETTPTVPSISGPDGAGVITVRFADPIPEDANHQGALQFEFEFECVEESKSTEVRWIVAGEEITSTIRILKPGDTPAPNISDSTWKSASAGNLNLSQYVSFDDDGNVTIDEAITDVAIPYTLAVDSQDARTGITISDALDSHMVLDQDSIVTSLEWWDENGLNKQTGSLETAPTTSASGFTFADVDLPAKSKLRVTYTAKISAEAIADLAEALQIEADKVTGPDGGSFSVNFENTAVLAGDTRTNTSVSIGGSKAAEDRPGPEKAFGKSTTLPWNTEIALEDDGTTLVTPLPVTYELKVDLTEFAEFEGTAYELAQDVIITDELPDNTRWIDGVVLTVAEGSTAFELTLVTDPAATLEAGQYRVDGQTLTINVGQNTATNITLEAHAEILNVEGVDTTENPSAYVATRFNGPGNTAAFDYGPGSDNTHWASLSHSLFIPAQTPGDGFVDSNKFSKTTPTTVDKVGDTDPYVFMVPYTFKINDWNTETNVDVSKSYIEDVIDHSVLDVSDLSLLEVNGNFRGQALTADDFVLSVNDEGNLIIAPSATFGSDHPQWIQDAGYASGPAEVTVSIPTVPVYGKQTLSITNKAILKGEDSGSLFQSSSSSRATSRIGELEVMKTLYDATSDQWVKNLRAELDDEGNLVEGNEFIYRIEVISHTGFPQVAILDILDVLPEAVDFIGFVTDANLATGATESSNSIGLGEGVRADWDSAEETVKIYQANGNFREKAAVHLNFKVAINDSIEPNMPIVNTVGGSDATIVPSDGYPLSIDKLDNSHITREITDPDARFTVHGPGVDGPVVTDQATVIENKIVLANGEAIVVDEPGTYYLTETVAPAGYELSDEVLQIQVGVTGMTGTATFYNTPGDTPAPARTYAIGDIVWVDTHADVDPAAHGDQGEDEFLDGVTVRLFQKNDDGDFVEYADTVTANGGLYLFDSLPEGEYQVQFELTAGQAELYEFTTLNADGVADDSNSDAVVGDDPAIGRTVTIVLNDDNAALTTDYTAQTVEASEGIDPTWDAGVVLKPEPVVPVVSVGDYVWVDTDRDGEQGDPADEPGIPGVVLEILDPNGAPVLDDEGNPRTETTDDEGKYLFDGLPVIGEDESYTVRIVRDHPSTEEALEPYVPTVSNNGGEGETDSSTWEAKSVKPLTEDGAEDLTLDFGFVTKTYAIGDVVWIDDNKDGLQDETERTLPGVTVILTDAEGVEIARTTTDEQGLYKFDELEAGTYRVQFVLNSDQAELYEFTARDAGDDALDSDADPATGWTIDIVLDDSNPALTDDYLFGTVLATQGIDPTWDAGVVLKELPVIPVDPETDEPTVPVGPPLGELGATGYAGYLWPLGVGVLLLLTGLGVMLVRRRATA